MRSRLRWSRRHLPGFRAWATNGEKWLPAWEEGIFLLISAEILTIGLARQLGCSLCFSAFDLLRFGCLAISVLQIHSTKIEAELKKRSKPNTELHMNENRSRTEKMKTQNFDLVWLGSVFFSDFG